MVEHPIIYELEKLRFSYHLGRQLVNALRGVSLRVPSDGLVCFSGPSGSGKTTLLNLLGLIEPVQEGALRFRDNDIGELSEKEKNVLRRYHIGFVFQQFHLLPVLTAEENVEYFLARRGLPVAERRERVREALDAVGLWKHRLKRPWNMSGGERQRVAVARAIAKRPDVIIADEPTANLDQATGREIIDIFERLQKEGQASIIIASHDAMVHSRADYHYVLRDGKLTDEEAP